MTDELQEAVAKLENYLAKRDLPDGYPYKQIRTALDALRLAHYANCPIGDAVLEDCVDVVAAALAAEQRQVGEDGMALIESLRSNVGDPQLLHGLHVLGVFEKWLHHRLMSERQGHQFECASFSEPYAVAQAGDQTIYEDPPCDCGYDELQRLIEGGDDD